MATRSVHSIALTGRTGDLLLEPWGMVITIAADDDIVLETTAVEPPEWDAAALTLYAGEGAELRVLRNGQEIHSTAGRPVPGLPAGMTTKGFLELLGIDKPPRD